MCMYCDVHLNVMDYRINVIRHNKHYEIKTKNVQKKKKNETYM